MSDELTTKLLRSTTDAQVWAREWCRVAREIQAREDAGVPGEHVIDEGWMIGWFANAMCVAIDHDHAQMSGRDTAEQTT